MRGRNVFASAICLMAVAAVCRPVAAETVVYSNQTNGGFFATGFVPLPVIWDDLQLTHGGTLSTISLIAWKDFGAPDPHTASGFIDLRIFDEANNRPQGTALGVIPFSGTFAALPSASHATLIELTGLEALGIVLPGTGRIGVGIGFDSDDWSLASYGPPTVGSSPGGNWLGNSSVERSDGGGDFGWRVSVAGTPPEVVWTKHGSGAWDIAGNWSTGVIPQPTQDVIVRGNGSVSTVTGPSAHTTMKSLTVGQLAFFNVNLQLQPGIELHAMDSVLVGVNGQMTINGGSIVTSDFHSASGLGIVFQAGSIEVQGGTFFPTVNDFLLTGAGNPTVVLDGATYETGFGETRRNLIIAAANGESGTFIARNGSTLKTRFLTVGQSGQSAQLTAAGAGTTVTVDETLRVAQNTSAQGALLIEDQAEVTAKLMDVGGNGTVTVDNGILNIVGGGQQTGDLRIGAAVHSSLAIQNGGVVNVEFLGIGDGSFSLGSSASVLVTGSDSLLNASGGISVGTRTRGTLRVEQGASVTTPILWANTGDALVAGDTTVVEIDGAGTHVHVTGSVVSRARTSITISGGATVTTGGLAASGGQVTVTGSETLVDATTTLSTVGSVGATNGTLRVEEGAVVLSKGAEIGGFGGTSSQFIISGEGSRLTVSDLFFLVGGFTHGTLIIEHGGLVERDGDVIVCAANNLNGHIAVTNPGSQMIVNGRLFLSGGRVGEMTFNANMPGTLLIDNGGRVEVSDKLEPFTLGKATLQDGTLRAAEIDLSSGGEFEFLGGTLHVGHFEGMLTNAGGMLAPGDGIGTTTVGGNYTQLSGGTLDIEIATVDQFDRLLIDGVAMLGGTLRVTLLDSFTPAAGDSFGFLSAAGGFGQFDALDLPTLPGGLEWQLNPGGATLVLTVVAALRGDFNNDGIVDAADYVVWRKTGGTQSDYEDWRANFGATLAGAAAAAESPLSSPVPEPTNALPWMLAAAAVSGRGRNRRRVSR